MSELRLGELVFDSGHFLFLPRLKALVCASLFEGLRSKRAGNAPTKLMNKIDATLKKYQPEFLVTIGNLDSCLPEALTHLRNRAKIIPISSQINTDTAQRAEALGLEIHKELVWGGFCFKENSTPHVPEDPNLPFIAITGPPSGTQYLVRLGKTPWSGYRLPVFLKGPGQVVLPSLNASAKSALLLNSPYHKHKKYDVFAIGHARILPLGKITDLGEAADIGGRLPFSRDVLGGSLVQRRQYGKLLDS